MSDQTNLKDYYANTAYTPAKRVAWEEANSGRQQISGSRLTWYRRTQDNGTKDEYGYNNIAISNNWENKCSELGVKGQDIFKAMRVHYDNKKIIPPSYSALSQILFTSMAFGKGAFYMFIFAFLFLVLVIAGHWIIGGQDFEYFKSAFATSFFSASR